MQAGRGSGHAVPMGTRGLLITVDQGRERQSATDMLAVVEDVGGWVARVANKYEPPDDASQPPGLPTNAGEQGAEGHPPARCAAAPQEAPPQEGR
jgi:hypothetical protein